MTTMWWALIQQAGDHCERHNKRKIRYSRQAAFHVPAHISMLSDAEFILPDCPRFPILRYRAGGALLHESVFTRTKWPIRFGFYLYKRRWADVWTGGENVRFAEGGTPFSNRAFSIGQELAEFHRKGRGYPYEVKAAGRIGQWKDLWGKRIDQLEVFWQRKVHTPPHEPFDKNDRIISILFGTVRKRDTIFSGHWAGWQAPSRWFRNDMPSADGKTYMVTRFPDQDSGGLGIWPCLTWFGWIYEAYVFTSQTRFSSAGLSLSAGIRASDAAVFVFKTSFIQPPALSASLFWNRGELLYVIRIRKALLWRAAWLHS